MNRFPLSKRLAMGGAIAGSLITGGVVGATMLGPTLANAATNSPTASSTASPSTGSTSPSMPPHGSATHENAEVAVTGGKATQAQTAAVKDAGGGTAGSVTTDFTQSGYEVTVTKADGSTVEIHLDSSFNVMQGRRDRNGANNSGSSTGPNG